MSSPNNANVPSAGNRAPNRGGSHLGTQQLPQQDYGTASHGQQQQVHLTVNGINVQATSIIIFVPPASAYDMNGFLAALASNGWVPQAPSIGAPPANNANVPMNAAFQQNRLSTPPPAVPRERTFNVPVARGSNGYAQVPDQRNAHYHRSLNGSPPPREQAPKVFDTPVGGSTYVASPLRPSVSDRVDSPFGPDSDDVSTKDGSSSSEDSATSTPARITRSGKCGGTPRVWRHKCDDCTAQGVNGGAENPAKFGRHVRRKHEDKFKAAAGSSTDEYLVRFLAYIEHWKPLSEKKSAKIVTAFMSLQEGTLPEDRQKEVKDAVESILKGEMP